MCDTSLSPKLEEMEGPPSQAANPQTCQDAATTLMKFNEQYQTVTKSPKQVLGMSSLTLSLWMGHTYNTHSLETSFFSLYLYYIFWNELAIFFYNCLYNDKYCWLV